MTTITLRAEGSADAAVAWERYARPALWSTWSPPIAGVDLADELSVHRANYAADRIVPGLRGTVHGPLGVRVRFVVIDVDETRRTWSWRARLGPVELTLRHAVNSRPPGCSTELEIEGPAPAVFAYAGPARWALSRLVRA